MDLANTEIAWAAGFLEGEGCFSPSPTGFKVSAHQVDREPLDRLAKIFGVGSVYFQSQKAPRQNIHEWVVGARGPAMMIIGAIWPHLSRRRKEQLWGYSLKLKGFPKLEEV